MINIPEMIIIGGNSRNSGKTTMACSCISKLSATHEVIGLKITSVRPGEDKLHGNHNADDNSNFSIFEEMNPDSHKDTSKMLKAGATHVYYIRVEESFLERAVLHFMSEFITDKQVIVCESRSLRGFITPGLFLLMMRLPAAGKEKEISEYVSKADIIFNFGEDLEEIKQFTTKLNFKNSKFVWRS